jgi:hypothetical protein
MAPDFDWSDILPARGSGVGARSGVCNDADGPRYEGSWGPKRGGSLAAGCCLAAYRCFELVLVLGTQLQKEAKQHAAWSALYVRPAPGRACGVSSPSVTRVICTTAASTNAKTTIDVSRQVKMLPTMPGQSAKVARADPSGSR